VLCIGETKYYCNGQRGELQKTATAASSVVAFVYLYQSCQSITSAHKESMYFYENRIRCGGRYLNT
jgi:hypothetical protein